jgi:hypothetical protein
MPIEIWRSVAVFVSGKSVHLFALCVNLAGHEKPEEK